MTRRIYFHIGFNKTGTTTLQHTLSQNRELLQSRGFAYPSTLPNHGHLADHLNPARRAVLDEAIRTRNSLWSDALRDEISNSKMDIIISSEGFSNIDPKLLRSFFPYSEIKIVVYIREQAEYIVSIYQQAVKGRGIVEDFREFSARLRVGFGAILSAWSSTFGRANLIARAYDRERLVNGDIVGDFLATLRIDPQGFVHPKADPNPSIGGALLEAKRRINSLGIPAARLHSATFFPLTRLPISRPEYSGRPYVDPIAIEEIRSHYIIENRSISHEYFDGSSLFKFRPFPAAPSFSEQDVVTAIFEIAAAARQYDEDVADQIEAGFNARCAANHEGQAH